MILLALALLGCPGSARLPKRDGKLVALPDLGAWPVVDQAVHEAGVSKDITITTTPGGPCPCKSPLLCVKQACRQGCTQQACNGSDCAAGEACIMTSAKTPVCVPAGAATGLACSQEVACATGNLCLSPPGDVNGKCYLTCTGPDQPCATCTQIDGNECSYCAE
jgi:hypothetical protein